VSTAKKKPTRKRSEAGLAKRRDWNRRHRALLARERATLFPEPAPDPERQPREFSKWAGADPGAFSWTGSGTLGTATGAWLASGVFINAAAAVAPSDFPFFGVGSVAPFIPLSWIIRRRQALAKERIK
jgi:hypothetical protein